MTPKQKAEIEQLTVTIWEKEEKLSELIGLRVLAQEREDKEKSRLNSLYLKLVKLLSECLDEETKQKYLENNDFRLLQVEN